MSEHAMSQLGTPEAVTALVIVLILLVTELVRRKR